MILKEEEIIHFTKLRDWRFAKKHDQSNCRICNPRLILNLSAEEIEKVQDFIKEEGWFIDPEKITPNFEFDLQDYELFVTEDLITPRAEIDSWIYAKHAVEECSIEQIEFI